MNLLLIGLAVAVAAVLLLLLFKRSGGPSAAAARAPARRVGATKPAAQAAERPAGVARPPGAPASASAAQAAPAATTSEAEPPAELANWQFARATELPPERKQAYVAMFKDVPRPPRLLQHLISPEFLNAANSAQLVDLITAEPLIAAKVLTAVNSPVYGVKTTVGSVGQAVTYLGLNTVRSLCLQYILIGAFKADSPERKQVLESTWRASALASELAHQLAYRLGMTDPGMMVSAVVLSFLGRLATAATMPRAVLASVPARDLLARARAEQDRLGLAASEVGRLLMLDWGLPERIAADAADIDTLLVTPRAALDPAASHRLALCYLCARLGERLASGELPDLLALDLVQGTDAEMHHLRAHLDDARLARLTDFVREPALSASLQRMLQGWRA